MGTIKIFVFIGCTVWLLMILWLASLQIVTDELRSKQLQNDKRFGVMADALYLETTEKEFREKNGFKPDPLYGDLAPALEYIRKAIR